MSLPRYRFPPQAVTCPVCKEQTAITLESRVNKDFSRRRRRVCTECNHRYTTYEVDEAFYKTAIANQRVVDKVIKCLNLSGSLPNNSEFDIHDCADCVHMRSSGCGFDFPDAGGTFANECSMFEHEDS